MIFFGVISLIQQLVLFSGTLLSGVIDAKTGYIFDWITLPMIIMGVITSAFLGYWNNLLLGVIVFASLFFGYKQGKIGGGDVKLFTAIALLNPTNSPHFLFGIIMIACASAIIFFTTFFTIKYYKKGINLSENKKGVRNAIILGVIIISYFLVLNNFSLIPSTLIQLVLLISLFGLIFVALQEGVKKNFFEKKVKLSELGVDEIFSEENNSKKVLELLKGKKLLGEKEIALLKKHKVKEITILQNLPPFGPFIFLGVLLMLIQLNFFPGFLFV